MTIATLTSKAQMTLPRKIRDYLGVKAGDQVRLVPDGKGRIVMTPVKTLSLDDVLGKFPNNGFSMKDEEFDDVIAAAVVKENGF